MKPVTLSLILASAVALTACNGQTGQNQNKLSGSTVGTTTAPATPPDDAKPAPAEPAATDPNTSGQMQPGTMGGPTKAQQ